MGVSIIDKLTHKVTDWLMREPPPHKFPLSDFDRLRYEIKPADVLLLEGGSRVSEVIKQVTQSSWSHAALYIGRLHDIESPLLRKHVQEFYHGNLDDQLLIESLLGKGTIVTPLSEYRHAHIRICRPKGLAHQDAQKVIGYVIGHLGVKYDVRHIFDLMRFLLPWSIVPRHWRSSIFQYDTTQPIREICSALIAEAFNSVKFPILPLVKEHNELGVELFQRNPRLFTPSDFDYSPFFEIVKYPIFDMASKGALYRFLPWNKDGAYGNDDETILHPTTTPVPQEIEDTEKTPPVSTEMTSQNDENKDPEESIK